MVWHITVAGTVCLDDVTTPHGRSAGQQGGSAVYSALAASRHAPVHVVAVVGRDGEAGVRATLDRPRVDLDGLVVSDLPTRRWWAVHDFSRWTTASERSEEGATAAWAPDPPAAARAAEVLFLGSMAPRQQLAMLERSRARLVASDSMVVHIDDDRSAIRDVVAGSDMLFLNRNELAALTGTPEHGWREAAHALCGRGRLRAVVVKAGPLGAAVVTRGLLVEREAHEVDPVVDPTGAGDALAGGFLGACAAAERDDDGFLAQALAAGLRTAADAISAFGTGGLVEPAPAR